MHPNRERDRRMREALAAAGVDVLVLRLPENVLLLSGFWPMIGATWLLFPREGTPHCLIPHCYEAEAGGSLWEIQAHYYRYGVVDAPDPALALRDMLPELARGKDWKTVGVEQSFEAVAPSWNSAEVLVPGARTAKLLREAFPGSELVDATELLLAERIRKTPWELDRLRLVAEISCLGLEAFDRAVAVGASGVDLAALVEREVMARGTGHRGATRVRAYAQVAVGPEETAVGYRPNEISTTRRLGAGEVALLELGVVADGYWADRTRARVAGTPTEEQLAVFEVVQRAREVALAAIRPGVRGAEVDAAARAVIEDAGYGRNFPHLTGHGVGFGYHEPAPLLTQGSVDVLEEGMVSSVEPGIYFVPMGGIRIEDDVAVTADGYQVLGPHPRELA
jgi:Xaa-Pro dipeptidase